MDRGRRTEAGGEVEQFRPSTNLAEGVVALFRSTRPPRAPNAAVKFTRLSARPLAAQDGTLYNFLCSERAANCVELVMLARCILTIMATVIPAAAAELRPEEAKYLIAGKYFTYRCFDGTTGGGRINADGSVVGTIQPGGFGPTRVIGLPVGTVRVQSDSICASSGHRRRRSRGNQAPGGCIAR